MSLVKTLVCVVMLAGAATIQAGELSAPRWPPGLDPGLLYTGDAALIRGGIEDGETYVDNVDLTVAGDLQQLLGWRNTTFMVYVIGNHGKSPSAYAGDLQGVSNIDAPDTWKLYELWVERSFSAGAHSLRFGLYDFNSEFDVIDTAGIFLNGSFGIGAEIAQTGKNGPSIFPTTSLALRGRLSNRKGYYLQGVVLDGVAGDPDETHGTHIDLDGDDGLMMALETGRVSTSGAYHKIALGTWRYTRDIREGAAGNDISAGHNWGVYALAEAQVYREADETQGLAGFVRYGVADKHVNQLDAYSGLGLVYTGLFRGRPADQLGVALASARNSDKFRRARLPQQSDRHETTYELTYRAQITPWLTLQPGFQYVRNPGTQTGLDDARVWMLRFQVDAEELWGR